MQLTNEIKTSLNREYTFCSSAIAFYKKTIKEFEQKYRLTTQTFLKKFEGGELGDEADYFDWYAFANLLSQWQKTQSAIRSAVR
ncbi:MAG: hypothetical protein HY097_02415 [Nitrospinae bacterium]|nr:hypothetical protein [Nitrospinota bacterium]